jgi:hypothetical protein
VFLFGTSYRANATVEAEIDRLQTGTEGVQGAGYRGKMLRLVDMQDQNLLLREGMREWHRLWAAKGVR